MDGATGDMDVFREHVRRLAAWLNTCPAVPVTFAEPGFRQDLETVPQPFIELYLVTDGLLRLCVVDRAQVLRAGDMAIANAHFGNVGREVAGRFRYGCLSLEVPDQPGFADWTRGPLLAWAKVADPARLQALYREVAHIYHGPAHAYRDVLLKAAFLQLLAAAGGGGPTPPGGGGPAPNTYNPHVRKAVEIMAERRSDPNLALGKLARRVGVSPSHLARVFQSNLGRSPMSYLSEMRIRHAQSLLLRSSLSVKEISYMVGFRDQLYFSRVFRRETGLSPRAFRRANA
jgi:AraC-like DNA-binding protein